MCVSQRTDRSSGSPLAAVFLLDATMDAERVKIACEIAERTGQVIGVTNGTLDYTGKPKLFYLPETLIQINEDGTVTMPAWLARVQELLPS